MEYVLMEPPFEMKPFEKMSKKEAQRHFNWYVSEIPNRVELLREAFIETDGGILEDLDFSSQSLVSLWSWFMPRIETVTKTDEEITQELEGVPGWLRDKLLENKEKLSVGTISIAMDVAIYLGEVFIKNFEKLDWGYVTKPKKLAYVNSPVIVGFSSGVELDPRNLVLNLTLKVVNGSGDKEDLLRLFKAWKEDI